MYPADMLSGMVGKNQDFFRKKIENIDLID